MKKDTILGFIALILFVFALRTLADEGYYYESQNSEYASEDVNCQECCKGNFTSSECMKNCGSCMMYSDKAYAEERDFPTND